MPKSQDAGEVKGGKNLNLDEIGDPGPIEKVAETDFKKAAELEEFMNQKLEIEVLQDGTDGALPVILPSVNGINQPIVRGKRVTIKRKYVEALARSRVTKYEQDVPDASKPENIRMLDRTSLTYPFSVYRDPDPRGPDWLKSILDQP